MSPAPTRRAELAAAVFSALLCACAIRWHAEPGAYPIATADDMSLVSGPWGTNDTVAALVLGIVGLLAALIMGRGARHRAVHPALVAVAAVEAFVLCGIVADIRVLMLLGYLLALLGPVVLLALVAVSAWRHRVSRFVLAALVVGGGVVGTVTGLADLDGIADIGAGIAGAFGTVGPMILTVAVAFGGGCIWVWCLVRELRRGRSACVACGRMPLGGVPTAGPGRAAGPDWGTWVTVAAAVGPLPYGLTRLTWLTPWPFGMDRASLVAEPGMRLFGLFLGLAAIGASVLTIGLIRPWGEVFPRWLPWLRGRPVPVLVPAVLAVTVGAAITIAGRSVLQVAFDEDAWLLLVLPLPVWGPLLVAAGVAYHLRRRAACATCGLGSPADPARAAYARS